MTLTLFRGRTIKVIPLRDLRHIRRWISRKPWLVPKDHQ